MWISLPIDFLHGKRKNQNSGIEEKKNLSNVWGMWDSYR